MLTSSQVRADRWADQPVDELEGKDEIWASDKQGVHKKGSRDWHDVEPPVGTRRGRCLVNRRLPDGFRSCSKSTQSSSSTRLTAASVSDPFSRDGIAEDYTPSLPTPSRGQGHIHKQRAPTPPPPPTLPPPHDDENDPWVLLGRHRQKAPRALTPPPPPPPPPLPLDERRPSPMGFGDRSSCDVWCGVCGGSTLDVNDHLGGTHMCRVAIRLCCPRCGQNWSSQCGRYDPSVSQLAVPSDGGDMYCGSGTCPGQLGTIQEWAPLKRAVGIPNSTNDDRGFGQNFAHGRLEKNDGWHTASGYSLVNTCDDGGKGQKGAGKGLSAGRWRARSHRELDPSLEANIFASIQGAWNDDMGPVAQVTRRELHVCAIDGESTDGMVEQLTLSTAPEDAPDDVVCIIELDLYGEHWCGQIADGSAGRCIRWAKDSVWYPARPPGHNAFVPFQ